MDKTNISSDDISNINFDFSKSGVSEDEYYGMLDKLLNIDSVINLKHSLPLNEIQIIITNTEKFEFNIDNYEGIYIDGVYPPPNEYLKESNCKCILMNTTEFLCTEEEKENYFRASYSDEAMIFLNREISLFDEVKNTSLIKENKVKYLEVKMKKEFENTCIFNDIINQMGFSIRKVYFNVNNNIEKLQFMFNNKRKFSLDKLKKYNNYKIKIFNEEMFKQSDNITKDGKQFKPSLLLFLGVDSIPNNFEICKIGDYNCYKIPVKNTDDLMMEIKDYNYTDNRFNTFLGYKQENDNFVYPIVNYDNIINQNNIEIKQYKDNISIVQFPLYSNREKLSKYFLV